jgi:molybdopterin-containing oxidoreductase family iron-sulfur binding subunit
MSQQFESEPQPAELGGPVDRREFLAVTAAAAALAGAAGCSPRAAPVGELVPYVRPPDGMTPGEPLTFATATSLGGVAVGLVATSREGRPTKVDGNPSHAGSLGGSDIFSQASILGLYDPDRSQQVTFRGAPRSWDEALAALRTALAEQRTKRGAGLRLLSGAVTSPTLAAQVGELLKEFPDAKWVRYEPASGESLEGAKRAFGEPLHAVYDFSKADVILALDTDFLSCEPGTVRYQREYADRRRVRQKAEVGTRPDAMARLYAVESTPSTTGVNADHRLPLKPSEVESFARALAAELKVAGAPAAGPLPDAARAWLAPLASDLTSHRGRSLVLVGETQPASLHALGHALNSALGNIGGTVRFTAPLEPQPTQPVATLRQLVDEMNAGRVELLLILGANPVYASPADIDFAAALKHVRHSVHLGLYQDETAAACGWHIPEAHYLEAWGDARGYDGGVVLQQPLILPLYGGRSALEFLAALRGHGEQHGRELVRDHWRRTRGGGDFDSFWQKSVQAGVVAESALPAKNVALRPDWARGSSPIAASELELHFRPDPTLYDGRFANNGWLQELPKPVTKLTWDNAAFLSPALAERLGVVERVLAPGGEHGHVEVNVLELRYRGRTLHAPAFVIPGHADGTVTIHLGHGRTRAGRVGNNVGFSAYRLRTSDAPWFGTGLEVAKLDQQHTLAATQMHHRMQGEAAVRHFTPTNLPTTAAPIPPPQIAEAEKAAVTAPDDRDRRMVPLSLYSEWPYPGYRWAMAIDLSACTGCSACVVACQAENNIPVVGKREVVRGREMHWIRIDRYTPDETGRQFFQPVPCMHCEKAPCELVCPPGATVHSADGLNDMVYNRCIGTRYCSNNCPYKVRRFNFLHYADYATESLKLLHNPDVTVRSRGVMEKCTYCIQRIRHAEIEAEALRRPIPDGSLQTACQQACPSRAIVFGDWNDSTSEVGRWKAEPRNYGLLADLNTQPRTSYLAAVRNPNPTMPEGA